MGSKLAACSYRFRSLVAFCGDSDGTEYSSETEKDAMWHYIHNNQRIGPVDENIIRALIRRGTVVRETAVWKEGMQNWSPAGTTELQAQFSSMPPTPPPYYGPTASPMSAPSYSPGSFKALWLWFAWLEGVGLILGLPLFIAGAVISYILLYRLWHIIQDGAARTSPGKAVGFCFIPFFNLYWVYVAIVGLVKDMNAYCNQHNIEGPRANEGLALTWFVLLWLTILFSFLSLLIIVIQPTSSWLLLYLLTLIPYFGLLIAVVVIWIILCKQCVEIAVRITEVNPINFRHGEKKW
jgi:hypothetical protein